LSANPALIRSPVCSFTPSETSAPPDTAGACYFRIAMVKFNSGWLPNKDNLHFDNLHFQLPPAVTHANGSVTSGVPSQRKWRHVRLSIQMVTQIRLGFKSLICSAAIWSAAQTQNSGSVYLVADEDGRWCAFRTEKLWTAAKAAVGAAPVVARINYANGRAGSVYLTTADETGDWTIYDKYVLSKNGQLTRLERTIDITGQMKEEEWVIRSPEAIMEKSVGHSLSTHAVIPKGAIWLPHPPVVTETSKFPFWRLVTARARVLSSAGRVCDSNK
jgi:hypothetical protein